MNKCNLHTILRLPSGIFYAQGVQTNVLFFDRGTTDQDNTQDVWIYDMRHKMRTFGKRSPLNEKDFAEFEKLYCPDNRTERKETYDAETNPEGRWRRFTKDISVHYMNQQPIINIEVTDQSDLHQYPYLIIKIEENVTTSNWTYSEIQFDISPYIEYDYDESIKLTEKRYHYNTLNKQYQLYELQSNSPYVVIEFASCGSSNYQFAFSFFSGRFFSKYLE